MEWQKTKGLNPEISCTSPCAWAHDVSSWRKLAWPRSAKPKAIAEWIQAATVDTEQQVKASLAHFQAEVAVPATKLQEIRTMLKSM